MARFRGYVNESTLQERVEADRAVEQKALRAYADAWLAQRREERAMKATEEEKAGTLYEGYRINGCTLGRKLGQGSFGEVWSATTEDGRAVALKIALEPEFARMLAEEGRIAHGLDHPGIVDILGSNPGNSPPYVMMELVEGKSLRDRIRDEGAFTIDAAVNIIEQIALALDHAHKAGVIHRDIKPANVLLAVDGTVKVTDFGLGKMLDTARSSLMASGVSRTASGVDLVGTINYMSPEQKRGEAADARADVYALGVVFFELLTGELPDRAEKPSDHRREVPPALDAIFASCCARLERRFSSMRAVLNAIQYFRERPEEVPPTTLQKVVRVVTAPARAILWCALWAVFALTTFWKVAMRPVEVIHRMAAKRLGRRPVFESRMEEIEKEAEEWAAVADRMKRRALDAEGREAAVRKRVGDLEVDLQAMRAQGGLQGVRDKGVRRTEGFSIPGLVRTKPFSAYDVERWDGSSGSTKLFTSIAGKSIAETNLQKPAELPFRAAFDALGIQVALTASDGTRLSRDILDKAASTLAVDFSINMKSVYVRPVCDLDDCGDGKTFRISWPDPYRIGCGETFRLTMIADFGCDEVRGLGGIKIRGSLNGNSREKVE